MTALSEQAVLAALDVDEIADYEQVISELEYQIYDCQPEDAAALEEEKKRLRRKANDLTNKLKNEGMELNNRLTQVKKNGQIWLECDRDGWHELSKEKRFLATIEQGTTEYLARILAPESTEPEYFVPQGIYYGIAMSTRPFLETALRETYPGIQIVSEEEFQQAVAQREGIA